jgi:hypothetical protein
VWLKGDLHLHSSYSTDALDNPVAQVRDLAESFGMDYFVYTDHDNHVNGDIQTWADPEYRSDTMLLLYGTEYTTARGHANFFGTAPWDHLQLWALRDDPGDGAVIAAKARELGLHFSINHPINGDPWEFSFDISFDSMEVWNAMWRVPTNNGEALALWDTLLMGGRRVPGRGGSDVHHQMTFEANLLNVGNPTTWVLAAERTPQAVLDGIAAGRVSVSYSPGGERLELWADGDGDGEYETAMGDSLPLRGADEPLALQVRVEGFRAGAPYELVIVRDGLAEDPVPLTAATYDLTLTDATAPTYVRVELRGEVPLAVAMDSALLYGDQVALSNPIYVGYP